MVKIFGVEKNGLADKAGICSEDVLVSVNGNEINDVLDYRFYLTERKVRLELIRNEKHVTVKIKKDEYDDIGLEFETPLMDKKHSCKNKCIFCFIDQNPKGMRDSIYFKDDDSRLSFIHGNYITLTNMTDADVERIIKMRISPINVSVHTTDPELRVMMMKNKRSGEVLSYIDRFVEAGLTVSGQVVLCRGVNDGEALRKTLTDLSRLMPGVASVAVVPAGLTAHRDGLYPLCDFTPEEAGEVIDIIDSVALSNLEKHGMRGVYASDELFLKSGRPLPEESYYEGYPQIENGVGLLRSFSEEFGFALEDIIQVCLEKPRRVTVATGMAACQTLTELCGLLSRSISGLDINVVGIKNDFFGHSVTVSGLLTGRDILAQLRGCDLGDELIISSSSLRREEKDFLCGMTASQLADALGVTVCAVPQGGGEFLGALIGDGSGEKFNPGGSAECQNL